MSIVRKISEFWPEFIARLTARSERGAIDSVNELNNFIATRSAFVAQKTLYGYLKTRMGTRYPSVFEDDQMIASINIAKMHVYAACVADLTIFCLAHASKETEHVDSVPGAAAPLSYDWAIAENVDDSISSDQRAEWRQRFLNRLDKTDWRRVAIDAEQGIESPTALLKWAPIAPELKKFDVEVVRNSVRFTWHEVRSQFRKRCDGAAIMSELSGSR